MRVPTKPLNEEQRLLALHNLKLLDTEPEARFDRICKIAQKLFDVPVVLVTLVDEERQWFKSCVGLDIHETSRDISICGHTILGNDLLEVADALEDPRFEDNPLVIGYPGIRFYVGAPLTALDGSKLGTLCMIDTQPRQLSDEQRKMLQDLATLVEEQLHHSEMRVLALELSHADAAITRDKARTDIRQRLHNKVSGLNNCVNDTLKALLDSSLDTISTEKQRSIRHSLLKLKEMSEDIEALLSPSELNEATPPAPYDAVNGTARFDPQHFFGSVMIVDDEAFVLKVTAHALKNMGFAQVLTAETGQNALDLLNSASAEVRLALVDLNMPDMDGIELLRRFDEIGYEGDILLFSAEDNQTINMAEELAKARQLSILGSIGKPVQQDRLLELMTKRSQHFTRRNRSSHPPQITPDRLAAAIEAEEIEPWFQPKIDTVSRQPVGVEMLARWPNGPDGPIFPDQFIPVAESSGLIDRLTFSLISKAVGIEREWRSRGIQLKIAVNLSMQSLLTLDFPQQLEKVVEEAGGSLGALQLEVTESSLMEDVIAPLDVLLRLRLKKVQLSIDDFGTGHSNLAQLRDLPFDELKLDRSYVRGDGERSKAILESSVEIAKKMGMSIVAEGVETLEDWKLVEQLGCDQVQGWFCAKAMPGSAIPQWMDSWPTLRYQLFTD